jgi:hypothetical protein
MDRLLETRGFKEDGGRDPLRHRQTAGAGTVGETQHLSKGVFQLYRGEREPFLKRGQEKKIVGAAIMQRQDREDHIVPFHTISMVIVYLIGRRVENWNAQFIAICSSVKIYEIGENLLSVSDSR